MLKKSSRRVFGLVTAALIASVAAAQPVPAAAPTNGTVYAVAGPSSLAVKLDLSTGARTTVSDLSSLSPSLQIAGLVADQGSPQLYGVAWWCACGKGGGGPVEQIVTIDSQTSAYQLTPVLSRPIGFGMALDPSTHNLYSVAVCLECQPLSLSIVLIDPHTGAETTVAPIPSQVYISFATVALAPASHTLYITFAAGPETGQLMSVDTTTGSFSLGPTMSRPLESLAYDARSGTLFGITSSTPQQLDRVDPATGQETVVTTFSATKAATSLAIDPATNTAFVSESDLANPASAVIASISDQTGAGTLSPPINGPLSSLAFQPAPITPESIQTDVRSALATGAIDNAGVASSLLAKLSAAADARSHGQCSTAANVYASFIGDLSAQSGKHVAAATAAQLTSEAQFLIATCA